MMKWVAIAAVFLVMGCVGRAVPVGQVYTDTQENFVRLQRVVEPLLLANADLCRDKVGVAKTPQGRDYCAIGVAIVRSTEFNAWTDSKTVYIGTLMMGACRNDGELAAIIAHEIGHIIKGHVQDKRPFVLVGAFLDGAARGQGIATDGAFKKLGATVFNKDREREADRVGAYLMARAGFAPEAGAAFWDRMPPGNGGWLATHPQSPERAENLMHIAQEIDAAERAGKPLIP